MNDRLNLEIFNPYNENDFKTLRTIEEKITKTGVIKNDHDFEMLTVAHGIFARLFDIFGHSLTAWGRDSGLQSALTSRKNNPKKQKSTDKHKRYADSFKQSVFDAFITAWQKLPTSTQTVLEQNGCKISAKTPLAKIAMDDESIYLIKWQLAQAFKKATNVVLDTETKLVGDIVEAIDKAPVYVAKPKPSKQSKSKLKTKLPAYPDSKQMQECFDRLISAFRNHYGVVNWDMIKPDSILENFIDDYDFEELLIDFEEIENLYFGTLNFDDVKTMDDFVKALHKATYPEQYEKPIKEAKRAKKANLMKVVPKGKGKKILPASKIEPTPRLGSVIKTRVAK